MEHHVKCRFDLSRDEIISNLYNGKNFRDCIGKMEPDHLRDDLMQEVILVICELPEVKLFALQNTYKGMGLVFYTVRVIQNMIISTTSPFAKKYRRIHIELSNHEVPDHIETEERELREMIEDMAIEEIDKLYWYNKGLIELYMQFGNFRAVGDATKIPHTTVFKTIKKDLLDIKRKVS